MRSDIKYLSIGLFIGLIVTVILIAGMIFPPSMTASMSTKTSTHTKLPNTSLPTSTKRHPTRTYTPTPTLIGAQTSTYTFTPSATPIPPSPTLPVSQTMQELLENGHITIAGPLSMEQQFRVYGASVKYMRQTSSGSKTLGEQINGQGLGSPTDICGPLSIAILRDAGLIPWSIDPHDFWLLNPDVWDDRYLLLAKAFPPEYFENTRVRLKLDKVDWKQFPLFPGDFIYIYAGTGGNFEHMLVVNRVDSEGRAYSVTNKYTDQGFVITEVLLYHPDKTHVGMFAVWTERPNKLEGATGFGGFEVWRMR